MVSWIKSAWLAAVSSKVLTSKVRSAIWSAVFVVRVYLRVLGRGVPLIGWRWVGTFAGMDKSSRGGIENILANFAVS